MEARSFCMVSCKREPMDQSLSAFFFSHKSQKNLFRAEPPRLKTANLDWVFVDVMVDLSQEN